MPFYLLSLSLINLTKPNWHLLEQAQMPFFVLACHLALSPRMPVASRRGNQVWAGSLVGRQVLSGSSEISTVHEQMFHKGYRQTDLVSRDAAAYYYKYPVSQPVVIVGISAIEHIGSCLVAISSMLGSSNCSEFVCLLYLSNLNGLSRECPFECTL